MRTLYSICCLCGYLSICIPIFAQGEWTNMYGISPLVGGVELEGEMWLAFEHTVARINLQGDTLAYYTPRDLLTDDETIHDIFLDHTGRPTIIAGPYFSHYDFAQDIWISTSIQRSGLHYVGMFPDGRYLLHDLFHFTYTREPADNTTATPFLGVSKLATGTVRGMSSRDENNVLVWTNEPACYNWNLVDSTFEQLSIPDLGNAFLYEAIGNEDELNYLLTDSLLWRQYAGQWQAIPWPAPLEIEEYAQHLILPDGNLLVNTSMGVLQTSWEEGRLVWIFRDTDFRAGTAPEGHLIESTNGDYWYLDDQFLKIRYWQPGQSPRALVPHPWFPGKYCRELKLDENGRIWAIIEDRLYFFSGKEWHSSISVTPNLPAAVEQILPHADLHHIVFSETFESGIGTIRHIQRWNGSSWDTLSNYPGMTLPIGPMPRISQDNNGFLWLQHPFDNFVAVLSGGSWHTYEPIDLFPRPTSFFRLPLVATSDGSTLLTTDAGIFRIGPYGYNHIPYNSLFNVSSTGERRLSALAGGRQDHFFYSAVNRARVYYYHSASATDKALGPDAMESQLSGHNIVQIIPISAQVVWVLLNNGEVAYITPDDITLFPARFLFSYLTPTCLDTDNQLWVSYTQFSLGTISIFTPNKLTDFTPPHLTQTQFELQVYPNPAQTLFQVYWNNPQEQINELTLYDNRGAKVALLTTGRYAKGLQSLSVVRQNWPAGLYWLQLRVGAQIQQTAVVLYE